MKMAEKNVLILANDTTYTYNLRDELIKGLIDKGARVHFAGALEAFVDELKGIGCEVHPISVERRWTNPLSDMRIFMCCYIVYAIFADTLSNLCFTKCIDYSLWYSADVK